MPSIENSEYDWLRTEALKFLETFNSFRGNSDVQRSRDAWFEFLNRREFADLAHTASLSAYRYPDDWPAVNVDFYRASI